MDVKLYTREPEILLKVLLKVNMWLKAPQILILTILYPSRARSFNRNTHTLSRIEMCLKQMLYLLLIHISFLKEYIYIQFLLLMYAKVASRINIR